MPSSCGSAGQTVRPTSESVLVGDPLGAVRSGTTGRAARRSRGLRRLLTEGLFTDPAVREGFVAAFRTSQALDMPLRVRLFVGESALELHSLRWETLRDPVDGSLLITHERFLFSRYLSSHDWRPVRLRPQGDLRALVVVANPSDLERYDSRRSTLRARLSGPG